MFDNLSEKLNGVFDGLRKRGSLNEEHISDAMRDIRVALLEADVALPVARQFIKDVKEKALGQDVLKSVTPGQMVISIIHNHLVELLGSEHQPISLNAPAPVTIMMVGLQGSGKTTTTGKLALKLREKQNKKVLMASLDIYRPAAQKQLAILGEQTKVDTLPIVEGEKPEGITKRAIKAAKTGGYDVLMLDTAGRLHIDNELMGEVQTVAKIAEPHETILVADAMTGQDVVQVAEAFRDALNLTGVALTRMDSDARGGAALSLASVTGCPIKLMGMGEKLHALEDFHPQRVADRILGLGDVATLVEKAAEQIDQDEAEKLASRMQKGRFDLNDMLSQFRQMRKMDGIGSLLGMIPGMGGLKEKLGEVDVEGSIKKQEAIIFSMTPQERRNPSILKASRKRRIAAGSGSTVSEVNKLLKQFQQMQGMMKKVGKMDKKSLMRQAKAMSKGLPGGMPDVGNMDMKQLLGK